MKKVSKMVLIMLVVVLILFPLAADAKTDKVFGENFAQENGTRTAFSRWMKARFRK